MEQENNYINELLHMLPGTPYQNVENNTISDVVSEIHAIQSQFQNSIEIMTEVIRKQKLEIDELKESIRQTDENIAGIELGL